MKKKKQKKKMKIAKEEENAIPYVTFTFRQWLVRKRKEEEDKKFYGDDMKRQKQRTCAKQEQCHKAS